MRPTQSIEHLAWCPRAPSGYSGNDRSVEAEREARAAGGVGWEHPTSPSPSQRWGGRRSAASGKPFLAQSHNRRAALSWPVPHPCIPSPWVVHPIPKGLTSGPQHPGKSQRRKACHFPLAEIRKNISSVVLVIISSSSIQGGGRDGAMWENALSSLSSRVATVALEKSGSPGLWGGTFVSC